MVSVCRLAIYPSNNIVIYCMVELRLEPVVMTNFTSRGLKIRCYFRRLLSPPYTFRAAGCCPQQSHGKRSHAVLRGKIKLTSSWRVSWRDVIRSPCLTPVTYSRLPLPSIPEHQNRSYPEVPIPLGFFNFLQELSFSPDS